MYFHADGSVFLDHIVGRAGLARPVFQERYGRFGLGMFLIRLSRCDSLSGLLMTIANLCKI